MNKLAVLSFSLVLIFILTVTIPYARAQAHWTLTFTSNFTDLNLNIGILKGNFSLLVTEDLFDQEALGDVRGIIRTSGSQFRNMGFDFLNESIADNHTRFFRHFKTPVEDRFTVVQHPGSFPWDRFELGFLLSFNETVTFHQGNLHVSIVLAPSIEDSWQVTWSFLEPVQISNEELELVSIDRSSIQGSEETGFKSHHLLWFVFTRQHGDTYSIGVVFWILALFSLVVLAILIVTYMVYKCGGTISILSIIGGLPVVTLFQLVGLGLSRLTYLHYFAIVTIIGYVIYALKVFLDALGPKMLLVQDRITIHARTRDTPTVYKVLFTAKNLGGKTGRIRNFIQRDVHLDPSTPNVPVSSSSPGAVSLASGQNSQLELKIEFKATTDQTIESIRNLRSATITYEFEAETARGFRKKRIKINPTNT